MHALNRTNKLIQYTNEVILPFNLLHVLMIAAITFLFTRREMTIAVRFVEVTTRALAVYKLLIKLISVARCAFGMRLRKRQPAKQG
jgi:hypothetical protein